MRVTRETLLRLAKETAQERAYNDSDIAAVYLVGSLLNVEPMLGGAADIDLIFVQKSETLKPREFIKLTPDFHLDVSRRAKSEFKSPRELRGDPWLGYELYDPILLYEREKFFDFVQASLRAGFDFEQPPLVLQRCRTLLAHGRGIWFDLSETQEAAPASMRKYLKALFHVVNAVAELSGPPIYDRRLLLEFPARAEAAQRPELTERVFTLCGAGSASPQTLSGWLPDWRAAFLAACGQPGVDIRIHSARLNYYEKAIKAMLGGATPLAALWALLQTWTASVEVLPEDSLRAWQNAVHALGFGGEGFAQRIEGLDLLIDDVEALLENFAKNNGVEFEPVSGL
ncbi:MAG: hypothetical protein Fur002_11600 [Anaerolineales bacterium]